MNNKLKELIEDTVCEIMKHDGPDGYIDGYEVICSFIYSLLNGKGEKWSRLYKNKHTNE